MFSAMSPQWNMDANGNTEQHGSTITLAKKEIDLPFDAVVCATYNGHRKGSSGYISIAYDDDLCYKEASEQWCAPGTVYLVAQQLNNGQRATRPLPVSIVRCRSGIGTEASDAQLTRCA